MLKGEKIETRNKRTPLEQVAPLNTPFILFIDPCGACNFRCNFCPCNKSGHNAHERHKMMPFEMFKKTIDDAADFPEKIKVIYLYGFGEPLLNKDFFKMARYLKDKDICREIRVVTNGSLLSPSVNQELVDSGVDLVRISIEALNSEKYKELCDYDIDFEALVNNIKDLYERSRGKLKVAAKIVNATLKTEEDTKLFFDTFDPITDFAFVEDIVNGWPEFDEMVMPETDLVESDNWIWKRDHYTRCSFSLTMMMIHSNGDVSPCPNDWKMALNMGNISDKSLTEIWNSDKWAAFQLTHMRKDRSEIPFCKNCICGGYDNVENVANVIAEKIEKSRNNKKSGENKND